MSNRTTTDFQEQMVAAVEKLAAETGVVAERQFVEGETEKYYIVGLAREETQLKVYVYLDEAGFYQNDDWHMYERCDYDSPDELQRSVLSDLKARLTAHGSTLPNHQ